MRGRLRWQRGAHWFGGIRPIFSLDAGDRASQLGAHGGCEITCFLHCRGDSGNVELLDMESIEGQEVKSKSHPTMRKMFLVQRQGFLSVIFMHHDA